MNNKNYEVWKTYADRQVNPENSDPVSFLIDQAASSIKRLFAKKTDDECSEREALPYADYDKAISSLGQRSPRKFLREICQYLSNTGFKAQMVEDRLFVESDDFRYWVFAENCRWSESAGYDVTIQAGYDLEELNRVDPVVKMAIANEVAADTRVNVVVRDDSLYVWVVSKMDDVDWFVLFKDYALSVIDSVTKVYYDKYHEILEDIPDHPKRKVGFELNNRNVDSRDKQ